MIDKAESADQCIPNIGPEQRRIRVISGFINLAVSVGILFALSMNAARPMWRAFLFFPLVAAAFGFFQATDKTCVALAARNVKNLDDGEQPVADVDEVARIKAQARVVTVKALLAGAAMTALTFLAP